ncbi:MAG: PEFG-CTERM sorting domain-containing protein, partial [Nitrosopumilus sp.]|nr:PEFG-CTERM sorting domain-containing protein [Nitrosopumilus sp.]
MKFVDLKIFYGFIALLIVSTGVSFAQEALISIETDDNNYDEGDTIVLSGNVNIVIGDTPVILQLFNQGNLVDIAQITVAEDGS